MGTSDQILVLEGLLQSQLELVNLMGSTGASRPVEACSHSTHTHTHTLQGCHQQWI